MTTAPSKLRVFVITENDPLYVIRFFDVFFAEYPRDQIELVAISISRAFHEPIWKTARRIHQFYGTWDFLRLLIRWLWSRLSGRSIASLARKHGIPMVDVASVNAPSFLHEIQWRNVDLVVSVAAPEVFKAPLLNLPRMGCINIHSGRLPQYRGMMPTFWQLLSGEPTATVTIHEMAEKLDAGGIIATLEFPLSTCDSLDRVIVGTKEAGARLMIETLRKYDVRSGSRPSSRRFDVAEGSYFRFPDAASVRAYRARGHRLI
jgi:methionyl-tRNA formyltransferase